MKVLTVFSVLIALGLAVALGLMHFSHEAETRVGVQELQAAQARIETMQREAARMRTQLEERQSLLDITRAELALTKTRENDLRLQLAQSELNAGKLESSLKNAQEQYNALQSRHREVKSELIRQHSNAMTPNPAE